MARELIGGAVGRAFSQNETQIASQGSVLGTHADVRATGELTPFAAGVHHRSYGHGDILVVKA